MARKGRELELLVEALEAAWLPVGAKIQSPDRLWDYVLGETREVDVSIRYNVGKTPILIIVECRNRQRVEDVTWVEQVATKCSDLHAMSAVIVTSRKFSKAALLKAASKNVAIRTLHEVTPASLAPLFASRLTRFIYRTSIRSVMATFNLPPEYPNALALRAAFESHSLDDEMLYQRDSGEYYSLNDIWKSVASQQGLPRQTPEDGSVLSKAVTIRFKAGSRFSFTHDGITAEVLALEMVVLLWCETVVESLAKAYAYQGLDGLDVRSAEYRFIAADSMSTSLMVHVDEKNATRATLRVTESQE